MFTNNRHIKYYTKLSYLVDVDGCYNSHSCGGERQVSLAGAQSSSFSRIADI